MRLPLSMSLHLDRTAGAPMLTAPIALETALHHLCIGLRRRKAHLRRHRSALLLVEREDVLSNQPRLAMRSTALGVRASPAHASLA